MVKATTWLGCEGVIVKVRSVITISWIPRVLSLLPEELKAHTIELKSTIILN